MTEQADKYRQAAQQMERLAELDEEENEMKDSVQRELGIELKFIFAESPVLSEHEEISKISEVYGLNASQARKELNAFPDKYVIQEKSIPDLGKCIDSITWLSDYTIPLKKMRYNEKDLHKLYTMKSIDERREVVDSLCKYWEAELNQKDMAYSKDYSDLHKEMRDAKKLFRTALSKISNQ